MSASNPLRSDPTRRPKPYTFRPPKSNRWVIAFCKWAIPYSIRNKLKVTKIEVEDDDLAKLRDLKGQRCLLMPSHSGGFEPYIILYLSKLLGDHYHYLAAMEAFEKSPISGWFMQRIGAYSIIRGAADRQSFQMTKQLLVDGKRWLVIFPEGQTVWQNDTVIPFQQGVVQLAFKAYETAVKQDDNASLLCVPIAIKFAYLQDMREERDASLSRLESRLFPHETVQIDSAYDRLVRVGKAVLVANEKNHRITPDDNLPFDARIQSLKEMVVRSIEQQMRITPPSGQALLDRVRSLFNAADRVIHEEPEASEYERQLQEERQQAAQELYDDLWRVLQFIAIYDGYVREFMTIERFMDVLCLLEMEVFGERRMWGPRRAIVKVGEAVDLRDHLSAYKADKREVIQHVTLSVESQVRQMLKTLADQAKQERE